MGNPELVSYKNCFLSEDPEQFAYYMKKTYDEQKTLLMPEKMHIKSYSLKILVQMLLARDLLKN